MTARGLASSYKRQYVAADAQNIIARSMYNKHKTWLKDRPIRCQWQIRSIFINSPY